MAKCVICGKYTKNNYLFCKDCYHEVNVIYDEYWDQYDNDYELRNDYFEIRKKCQNYNLSETQFDKYIMTMYALAELCESEFDSDYLINRVEDDINNLIEDFYEDDDEIEETSKTEKQSFNDVDFRNNWPREYLCEDGHYVRSLSEMSIDNWLYNHNIVHAYEKSVHMKSNPDDVVLSDFYLPQGNVYIEFWGIEDDEKYERRKQEKIKLYDKNNINRIDLNESHIKRLDDILPRELAKYIKKN